MLEIGAGSGLNFPRYAEGLDHIVALDPSPPLLLLAARRCGEARVPVSLLRGTAESLPFAGVAFDTVVTTWTLCSVADPLTALREARRVLKPGGKLLFVEHGLAPTQAGRGVAASSDAVLEGDCRRLPSRPPDRRTD